MMSLKNVFNTEITLVPRSYQKKRQENNSKKQCPIKYLQNPAIS